MGKKFILVLGILLPAAIMLIWLGFSPRKAESLESALIADGTIDPAVWGKAYPVQDEIGRRPGTAHVFP